MKGEKLRKYVQELAKKHIGSLSKPVSDFDVFNAYFQGYYKSMSDMNKETE